MEQQLGPLHDVADYYRSQDLLAPIDGLRSIDDVTAALLDALGWPSEPAS
jgi:hypothetical protein